VLEFAAECLHRQLHRGQRTAQPFVSLPLLQHIVRHAAECRGQALHGTGELVVGFGDILADARREAVELVVLRVHEGRELLQEDQQARLDVRQMFGLRAHDVDQHADRLGHGTL
jgi:hypothetical protein